MTHSNATTSAKRVHTPAFFFSLPWLGNATVRQTIRLLVSVALAGLVAWLTNLQEPAWALITAVIVTQSSITETMSSGRYQLVGTLIGAAASTVPITLMLLHWPLWLSFAVAFVPLSVLASWRPNTRMAVVTLMIATLFPTQDDPYLRPVERVLSILFGVGVSMLVSYVVLHEQARRDAFRNAAQTVRKIVEILEHGLKQDLDWPALQDLSDDCTTSLRKVQSAVEEARRERWKPLEQRDPMLAALPKTLRQLQMDSVVVARALMRPPKGVAAALPDQGEEDLRAGMKRGFDWIISRCEAEAVARTGEEYRVAAGIISALPREDDRDDEIVSFVLNILRADLITFIRLLGEDDTERA
ncbi:FUSC family protein [Acetobacter orientalis]|uniref:FUSC family protein n=1 Tax=Acetobacter orientalis TaxID=146474 RepID=A0A2Z5ZJ34_9PROT|nr:FUSC family protein [Acetobacter orientalis]MDN6040765.1 FUSC family protein [Acetobacter sp.]MCP1217042.1 FUSC family protein [Acetobacter orientalis]MCP1219946.1 FUSC family protein [Acetobacter orientalis]MCP1220284.1 FUSC family protein [Acetobacter orientalis]BBC80117.1 FUSC family protein [Acetobacter orientalis]